MHAFNHGGRAACPILRWLISRLCRPIYRGAGLPVRFSRVRRRCAVNPRPHWVPPLFCRSGRRCHHGPWCFITITMTAVGADHNLGILTPAPGTARHKAGGLAAADGRAPASAAGKLVINRHEPPPPSNRATYTRQPVKQCQMDPAHRLTQPRHQYSGLPGCPTLPRPPPRSQPGRSDPTRPDPEARGGSFYAEIGQLVPRDA